MSHEIFGEIGQIYSRVRRGFQQSTAVLSEPSAAVGNPFVDLCGIASPPSLSSDTPGPDMSSVLARHRDQVIPLLARMYRPDERLFVLRVRPSKDGLATRGLSWRNTAIAVLGLTGVDRADVRAVLGEDTLLDVCAHLVGDVPRIDNLGDIALILWATCAAGFTERQWVWERLLDLQPAERSYPTVQIAWALSALCHDSQAPVGDLRERVARRLLSGFNSDTCLFPHTLGNNYKGPLWHVACFPDLIYPVLALTHYFTLTGDQLAVKSAIRCAERFCTLQGPAGQWWWNYDWRTGLVIEPYPVYAVHQDAIAPMALLALQEATGRDFSPAIERGLRWIVSPPELSGKSLIDDRVGIASRKVARRDPLKISQYIQALAARIHPRLRVPGIDRMLPPRRIDNEDRPSHLGWLLYAWPSEPVSSRADVEKKR